MADLANVHAFYRGPVPPYPKLHGPIGLSSQRRTFELSEREDGQIEIASEDIEVDWARVGSCWTIESELGEDIWAGFVAEESWDLYGDSVSIPLNGVVTGLLEVEAFLPQRITGSVGSILRRAISSSQIGRLEIGTIHAGPSVDADLGGETLASLLDSLRDLSHFDYRIRTWEDDTGLRFVLDFGVLEQNTSYVLGDNEIVDGDLTRKRPTSSLTLLEPANQLTERQATTSFSSRSRMSREGNRTVSPIDERVRARIEDLDIGPAAAIHESSISEQVQGGTSLAAEKLRDRFRSIEEILVTVDSSIAAARSPRLSDLVEVQVANWANKFSVHERDAHIHAIEPHEEDGTRDLVLWVHPHG